MGLSSIQIKLLRKHLGHLTNEEKKDCVWTLRRGGKETAILYHKTIEMLGSRAGVTWQEPKVIECDSENKRIAIMARGNLRDVYEWSIGEVNPKTCKMDYPYAVAEKRAKDRVILKLLELHGHFYSSVDDFNMDEADRDKEGRAKQQVDITDLSPHTEDQFSKSKAEKVRQDIIEKINNFDNCTDLNIYEKEVKAKYGDKLNVTHWNAITDAFANRGLSLADAGLL